ncbi:uncharacterized protein LOC18094344 isoform X2 [Populus trichocarpa]|uniref:uncharacterized protein LOC18094344 isoform X2 n=1 Tax=Populus trichocarpa TaxID=3694 RepID=UPI002277D779|nr:uncharacterized protein LOC18094344 isoform X2 [Populus trichocarpa]
MRLSLCLKMKLSPSLLISLLPKRFIKTAPSPPTTPLPTRSNTTSSSPSSFTLQFLVNSCGLPLETALTASKKFHLNEKNIHKTQSLLHFLKSHHFVDTHIADLIKKMPAFLGCKVENNLKPKFEFLAANGVAAALKRCSWLLRVNRNRTMQTNIDLLIKEGLPLDRLAKLIISSPRSLLSKHDKIVYAVNSVKNLGLETNDTMFIYALGVKMKMTDTTWKKKIEVMKSLGWSEEEIFGTFKRCPQILQYSEKKIRITVDFFINSVDLGPEILLVYPSLFCLSVDKRVRPWYNVINVLKSKNLIKREKKFPSLLLMSEKKFLENYVDKYADDVPGLWEVYTGTANTKKKGT